MTSRFDPCRPCCEIVCPVMGWSPAVGLSPFTVISGNWALEGSAIRCDAAGELKINKGLPNPGYVRAVFRARLPDQTIALLLSNGANSARLEITIGEFGVDDAGTLSVKIDGVEQYVELPAHSFLHHQAIGDEATSPLMLLHCKWSVEGLRVEVKINDPLRAPNRYVPLLGTLLPLAWTPKAVSLIVDPLTGVVDIEGILVSRIETADELCVDVALCSEYPPGDNPPEPWLTSLIGGWGYVVWDEDKYAADAAVDIDPVAVPKLMRRVDPHAISITEDVRESGYFVTATIDAAQPAAVVKNVFYHVYSLFIDGGNHELRMYWKWIDPYFHPVWGLTDSVLRWSVYRAGTLLGMFEHYRIGDSVPTGGNMPSPKLHLGDSRIQLSLLSGPAGILVDEVTTDTFGGHDVWLVAGEDMAQCLLLQIIAVHCPLSGP